MFEATIVGLKNIKKHLFGLGAIVVMEFSLGVTLMIVKKTIENAIDSVTCNTVCESTLNALVLDYALPSAGLMMTIIVVEALMIYSSIRLYFHIRDKPKVSPATGGTSVVIQNVQMQNVAGPQQTYQPPLQQIHDPYVQFMAYPKQPMSIEQPPVEHMVNPPDYASLSQQQPQQPQQQQIQQQSQPPQYNELPSSTRTQPSEVVQNS
ncbi:uncharacterized protein LOC129221183 isoform X2 [Uloborus diversus]|uniref:uncharacterized protein LOC129221183 isoform X2 n=1 Tax=Uloborus diversus TaxID=327109 RepID=UPI00240A368B|nr:uncharacterized protein LOC129221183 isoform X2 [Uloborus diversus]